MELIEALLEDHKRIKRLIKEGKNSDIDERRKKEIFDELKVLVPAHAKAEEKALYLNAREDTEIKNYAYEGFIEHSLIEQLIEEDKNYSVDTDVWMAKVKIICDLLEHHLEEEETKFFPKVKKEYSLDERKEKGNLYVELFTRIFKNPNEARDLHPPKEVEASQFH